jgi:hypothetical protein
VSPDAFRRLALIAACTAYVVALFVAAELVSPLAAFAGAVLGILLAFALTLEQATDGAAITGQKPEVEGMTRREIEKRARQSRGDDD